MHFNMNGIICELKPECSVATGDVDEELGEPFTLQDLFSSDFKVQKLSATWLGGTLYLIKSELFYNPIHSTAAYSSPQYLTLLHAA